LNSEVILLTVCALGDWLERPLRAYLEKRAGELQSFGIKASPLVVQGDAANEILHLAEKNGVELIIISTHGRTGFSHWPLGNIASKVLQRSRIPIFLIRPTELETLLAEKDLPKILVAFDGSQVAESIIFYAEGLAGRTGSEVILLRVIEPAELSSWLTYELGPDWDNYAKNVLGKAEREAKRYLSERGSALKGKGVKVSSASLVGKPAQTILQYAEDNSISLIALATHGFSSIAKWAYGSVASKIIEGSAKLILLVRPPLPTSTT